MSEYLERSAASTQPEQAYRHLLDQAYAPGISAI